MSSHDELDDVLSSIKKKKATTGNGAGRTEILSIDMGNSEIDMTESGSYPRAERPRLRPAPEPADWGEDQGGLSSPPDRQKTERPFRKPGAGTQTPLVARISNGTPCGSRWQ